MNQNQLKRLFFHITSLIERYKLDLRDFLNGQIINHGHSEINIKPNFPELGIETRYNTRIPREMATTYARFGNQYKHKYQRVFSARFDKQVEDGQMLDEIAVYKTLKIKHFSTESDIGKI